MKNSILIGAIHLYCNQKSFHETSAAFGNSHGDKLIDLKEVFAKFFNEKTKKLSFTFKVENKTGLLKKKLADGMNEERFEKTSQKRKKFKVSGHGKSEGCQKLIRNKDEIPEAF